VTRKLKLFGNHEELENLSNLNNESTGFKLFYVQFFATNTCNHIPVTLNQHYCGIKHRGSTPDAIELVANGQNTRIEEHPWMAAIFSALNYGLEFWCGGGLITSSFVLTGKANKFHPLRHLISTTFKLPIASMRKLVCLEITLYFLVEPTRPFTGIATRTWFLEPYAFNNLLNFYLMTNYFTEISGTKNNFTPGLRY
jgi:hypothetical protein